MVPSMDVLPEYIIFQLQSDYVLKQIESITRHIGIPHLIVNKTFLSFVKKKFVSMGASIEAVI
jgi:hypothetical protein